MKGLRAGVVAADRDAGVAAVARRLDRSGSIMRQRAEHAIDHAEAGQAARGAGRRQHAVADGARRADHLDGAETPSLFGMSGGSTELMPQ